MEMSAFYQFRNVLFHNKRTVPKIDKIKGNVVKYITLGG